MRLGLAGGGTGGHMVPGLHLIEEAGGALEDLVWFVTGRAVEERVLAGMEERLTAERFHRVRLALERPGGGAPGPARLIGRVVPARRKARGALRRHGTEVLVGLGGFTSLPCVLAARSRGIPVALLEVNAVSGRATRWLAPLADRVLHAFPTTMPARPDARHVLVGPPLSRAFRSGPPSEAESCAARVELGFRAECPLLVVIGGSQGAMGLNRFLREHAAVFAGEGVAVLHQVGPGRLAEAAAPTPGYRAVEYIADVPAALRAATVVLCRGGASTLAEVAALRRPAWVVPYPHTHDDHQAANARELGAHVVQEASLDEARARELARLLGPAGKRARAALAMEAVTGRPALTTAGVSRILAEIQALAPVPAGCA